MEQFEGKAIWITGASSGIGEALCYELSPQRCKLLISSRNEKKLLAVRDRCTYPDNVEVLALDLADPDLISEKVREAWNLFGGVDILINNAGVSQRSLIVGTGMEVYRKLMEVNYLGTIALTKALLPYFIEKGSGHFVTVSSLMGKFGSPLRSGYCGAKHALHGFFDVLRMEHQKDGIAVTLICPGFIQTNIAFNALTADGSAQNKEDKATRNGMPVATCARKMVRAIAREKYECHIGGREVYAVFLKRFFPALLHRVVLKSQVI